MEQRLVKEQRSLSRKVKGSNRWEKQRLVVAKLQLKVFNQRKDWLHKKAFALANGYDVVVVEDLDLRMISQNKYYAKNQQDNWLGNFRLYLAYKLLQRGKHFVKSSKHFASTQLCSKCGYQNVLLKGDATTRAWDCPSCSTHHDRDVNAALNLKKFGRQHVEKMLLTPTVLDKNGWPGA